VCPEVSVIPEASHGSEGTEYRVGDQVELVSVPAGRLKLAPGVVGTIVWADPEAVWSLVSVAFGTGARERVYQLAPRHLRRIARAPAEAPA
jgi:hypothetical protein